MQSSRPTPASDRADAAPQPVEEIRFFLAGPTYVPMAARRAMLGEMVAHRSPCFRDLYATLTRRLAAVLRTDGEAYVATGSSTLVMESAVVSLVDRDVLNLTNGAFSERWNAICGTLGKSADRVSVPWGEAIDPDLVRQALRRKRYEAVTVVHSETSTGVLNPLAEIARAVREESDALLLVDTVSSLGGAPVEFDAWGLDLVLAGTQKALAAPPGLTAFTFSERAAERAAALPHRGFYTDLLRYRDKHRGGGTITTPAIPVAYALAHQLERIEQEGIEQRWQRHRDCAAATAEWAAGRGLTYAVARPADRSPTVSCLRPPAGVDAPALVRRLGEAGFTVAGGYGDWKPTTFRIGHMGEVRTTDLAPLFTAIDTALDELLEDACTAS
ncbi:MAG TPA: alanine--glyoxylate aminotransferase family protein [Thermoanaerobaculia bacterium]|nr:alanine--glyoxylate aminotransferase family protein [Thermoanaerobaculia bacterium]